MRWRVAALAGVMAVVLATPASAATLPTGSSPLPGDSSFQGGDGDQDDTASYADWQGFQAQGRVVHNPDTGLQFAGGNKEYEPGDWRLIGEGSGVSPGGDNIYDGWSAVEQVSGNTFLYLGFTREASTGTTFLAFELNRDARLWNNGHSEIPCRRTGDLLVAVAAHGNSIAVHLERWVTDVADDVSSCARLGHTQTIGDFPAGSAQGNVNTAPITSRLPGTVAPGAQIAPALFAETALNLTALLQSALHDSCFVFGSLWMHSRASDQPNSALKDFVAPQPVAVRSCAASGTKFHDLNANGAFDAGEPGIPGFVIFADYNNNGLRDANEPATETDPDGNYVLGDIRPAGGDYRLRETTLVSHRVAVPSGWTCSFPNASTPEGFADGPGGLFGCGWGPFSVASVPYASNRDFGNWLPARLTVRKRLFPGTDPGRFDLVVNGTTIVHAAGDKDSATIPVRPGTYDISEVAVPPTDPGAYDSKVVCTPTSRRRGTSRDGTSYTGLTLTGGSQATCTFVNVLRGVPAILVEKAGPTSATAGDTLHYRLYVTNEGSIPLTGVTVSDRACDGTPVRVSGSGDTLAPGDTWTFACSRKTSVPEGECVFSSVVNTGTGSGTGGDTTVSDSATITTGLNCPDDPVDPQPPLEPETPVTPLPQPRPPIPGPERPAEIEPPPAGTAGTAAFRAPNRCISRVSQLRLTGLRIRRFRVSVNGRLVATRTLRLLQRRATPLNRLLAPGRHRVSIRVVFDLGSATPPVTLARTITVCAPPSRAPRFTG